MLNSRSIKAFVALVDLFWGMKLIEKANTMFMTTNSLILNQNSFAIN